ncbi:MAG: hypothetical protein KatS3mg093_202 [Candidatus Parcubacteria bacterium]|nr:MAG: hypothetical protein KatS3mg093_202 [Candidatus Parcubacteria bacterium]
MLTTTSEKFSTSTIFESANTISQQTTVTTGSIFGTNTVSTNTVPISKTSTSTKPTSTLTKPTSTSTSTKSTLTSTKPTSTIVKISTNTDVTKSKTVIETSTTVNSRTSVTTTIPPSLILTSSKSTSSSVATSSSKLTSSPASTLSSKTTTKTAIKLISDNLTTSSSQVSFSTKTELTVAAETFMATSVPAEIITDFNAIERDLNLKALSLVEFENELNSFLAYQWAYGSLINLKIMVNNNPVPLDLIFSYFLRPTKIKSVEIENFKKNLSNKFAVLIFYGYSRKYPILIFEVKNPELAKNFNNQWMKNNMANDLQSLFLGKDPGKIISKFNLKKIDNFSYNIIYFQNNFQIGWSLVNNYLIYSASEAGLKEAINQLKK